MIITKIKKSFARLPLIDKVKTRSRKAPLRTEVPGEGKRRVWARQRGRGGGQDQTFPVARTATVERKRERERE